MKLNDQIFSVDTIENIRTSIDDVVSTRARIWELLDIVFPSVIYPDHINEPLNQINGLVIEMNRHLRSAHKWPFDPKTDRSTVFAIGAVCEHLARLAKSLIARTELAIYTHKRKG